MEKSMKKYAFVAAALLAAPIALTSCSSDDEAADVNPTFDGNSVKTQFAINVPHAVGTRMTSENTQNGGNFLGMTDVRLIPFTGAIDEGSVIANTILSLSDIGTSDITSDKSSKIYSDVNVPVGTDHFLFYGRAIGDDKFVNGTLTTTIAGSTTAGNITFALENVLEDGTVPGNTADANSLVGVLNGVVTAFGTYANLTGGLKDLYDDFVKLKAGSANSIKATLQALYNSANDYVGDGTGIGKAIQDAIVAGGVFTVSGTAPNAELTTANTFPQDLNLPDGAVTVGFDETNTVFSYNPLGNIGGTTNVDVTNITYPASLYYWVSTDVKTTNTEVAIADWPSTTSDWTSGFDSWAGTKVEATTRAIALLKNINYGVANLSLAVKCASSSLKDRTVGSVTNDVRVPSDGFPVTAILIGGQPTVCKYNFEPTSTATFTKTVYDKIDNGAAKYSAGTPDAINYTLLLPTKGENTGKVNFAIELTNNSGVDFYGANSQIIPNGGTFYLVGQLDAATGTKDAGDISEEDYDVFMSDYQSKAIVTINSLQNAYNTIPDLRAAGLQLGLSVDLEWEKGLNFNVTID